MGLFDFIKANRPLLGSKRYNIKRLEAYLEKPDLKRLKYALNKGAVGFTMSSLGLSKQIGNDVRYPSLAPRTTSNSARLFSDELNQKIEASVTKSLFEEFSLRAGAVIPSIVAPKLEGMETIKEAITLQLFAKSGIHILLLGDPGTGKTEFLLGVEHIYPHTAFGLGSGTSGVGLSVSVSGKDVRPGLLPLADNGICCIDELNLMKKDDYAALYSAMEKGFITYDKGGSHLHFSANARILATANPIGEKFRGITRDAVVRQLPFEPALLSRFTMVFLLRHPDIGTFVKIARSIVEKGKPGLTDGDVTFIKRYISHAESLEVEFPAELKDPAVKFSAELKNDEPELFFEVSPRLVHGLISLSKAHARMRLSSVVSSDDFKKAGELIRAALENRLE